MLLFLASVIEQLDIALEHVVQRDVHNARIGLMLTDNALELMLHQVAKDKAWEVKLRAWRQEPYQHQRALDKALGRSFRDKVSFARATGILSDRVSQSAAILHDFRNEVYHIGLQHEAILPALASFYFDTACEILRHYTPTFLGWGSNQTMPARAAKFFEGSGFFPGTREQFADACAALARRCGHDPAETISTLATHLDDVIEDQNTCIEIVSRGVYEGQQRTRDQAVVECQTWRLAVSDEGKKYARLNGFDGSVLGLVEWLNGTYPLEVRRDPISQWRREAEKLRAERDAHAALRRYHSFMEKTSSLREAISDSAAACEAEIDAAIDRARGK